MLLGSDSSVRYTISYAFSCKSYGGDWRQNLLLPDGREEHLQEVGTETLWDDCWNEEMLRMGTYPQYLKERITSRTGHMSNIATAEFLSENMTEHLQYIWLCHLSKDNNHPGTDFRIRPEGICFFK